MKVKLVVPAILFSTALFGYGQQVDRLGRPSWMSTPKPATAASEAVNPKVQAARESYFNVPTTSLPMFADLTKASNSSDTGEYEDFSTPEQLPTSLSDAVVTGTVVSQTPYLTADHTHVYSELQLKPDSIIKDASKALFTNQDAVILAKGGSLRLANGKVISRIAPGSSNPVNLNKKYLLFLHYLPEAQAYTVRKAWDLSGSQPREMDGDGHPFSRITSDTNNTTTQESLLSLVKARVSSE